MARRSRKTEYADTSIAVAAPTTRPLLERWWGKLLLLLVGTLLLTFSYAPFYQFWAGWIGLVPLLVVLRHTRSGWTAAFWAWIAGVLFFAANVWWLLDITGPGVIAFVLWLGLYWLLAAVVLRPVIRRIAEAYEADRSESDTRPTVSPIRWLFLLPTVWVGAEWIRGHWPFQGFSWFYMAHAQTPVLYLCQISDLLGEQGVSFWVVMINALVALFIFNGWRWRGLLRPVLVVAGIMLVIAVYGGWRFAQTESHLTPGPTVLVVQPDYPQSNTGEKGAPSNEIIDFHVVETNKALKQSPQTDLVVWSETMMPPLNDEAFAATERVRKQYKLTDEDGFGNDSVRAKRYIMEIARRYKTAMLVGGSFTKDIQVQGGYIMPTGRRNSAYYFARDTGELVDRFDKIHLVPFGEYIPFQETLPALYRQLIALGPPDMENYQLDRGDRAVLFELPKDRQSATQPTTQDVWRFVTPICFEDADADLNAMFFRGGAGRGGLEGGKKADFIVNVTNDGWFMLTMMPQHLQVGTFRSIENRVPTARSVNTGISGYIDSLGRTRRELLLPVHTEGSLVHQLMLDSRTTFFTRWGNLIGPAGAIVIAVLVVVNIVRRRRRA